MLTAHPDIFIKNEIPDVIEIFSEENKRDDIIERFDFEIQQAYGCDLDTFFKKNGKTLWGLKDPELISCFNCLEKVFFDSSIIFIVRDGRAVANSFMKNKWGLGTNIYYGALRWHKEIGIQEDFISRNSERCYMVKYEELVNDSKGELKKICEFLGVAYADEMYHYTDQPVYIKKTEQSKNIFKKPDRNLTNKWKNELTGFQIDIFESVAGDMLQKYGYNLVGKKRNVPNLLRLWYYLHQKIVGEIQFQYQWRVKGMIRKTGL